MTDASDLQAGVRAALHLVEAVDEPWLSRYAAQSCLDAEQGTLADETHYPGGAPTPWLLVYDRADEHAWIQSDAIASNSR